MRLGPVSRQASPVTLKIPAPISMPRSVAYDSIVPSSRRRPVVMWDHGSTREKRRGLESPRPTGERSERVRLDLPLRVVVREAAFARQEDVAVAVDPDVLIPVLI